MGTKPGWPDVILISPEGLFHGLEFKRRGICRLSPEQLAIHERASREREAGGHGGGLVGASGAVDGDRGLAVIEQVARHGKRL
jgi:hypothetical protein